MGWNLPPGCTDKDIDDAINGDGRQGECDCCGKMFPVEHLTFIRHDHPNSNAPCDTVACPGCRGEDEPDIEEMKTRILENNNQMLSDIIDQITRGRQ